MFRSSSNFDKLLDKATSNLLMEPDWPSILLLCDQIRQNDTPPKQALNAVKKKLYSTNQHTALYALLVLESMVKNCGYPLHEELTTRAFCDTLYDLCKTTSHETVRQKLLELIQAWNFAFRKNVKSGALKDTMNQMKLDGFKFPAVRESDAMFSADSAPEWADGEMCHRCRVPFNMLNRKHHCRACGQVFCQACSSRTCTLPKYGIEKDVRVCDSCFDQSTKPNAAAPKMAAAEKETDLPPEYVNSSLAQQSQNPPPRKSEDELREEEELQLALAISQSEAEAKEKDKFKPVTRRSPSPVKTSHEVADLDEAAAINPELAKYLNRSYWEAKNEDVMVKNKTNSMSPSAPVVTSSTPNTSIGTKTSDNSADPDLEDFITTLKSQVEIFINRMKSNSSRGRSIANDTSVQTLFMNITAMHSRLLRYIQQHDDSRLHFERLQDKLTQVKDARAALDDLRDEHREKLRREAEEAERQRQLQMAHKLDIMRKKKQEYLQYQRQLALQRVQEQEREMQMRQEHQKQQYLMMGGYMASQYPQGANPPYPPNSAPPPPPPQSQYHQPGPYVYGGNMPQSAPPQMHQPMHYPNYPPMGAHGNPMVMPPHPMQQASNPQFQSPPVNGSSEPKTAELISFDD